MYRTSGIKAARALFGLDYGTGEADIKCKEKMTRTCKESQKVSKLMFVADEVVVAKLSKRVGVMPLRAKGFT